MNDAAFDLPALNSLLYGSLCDMMDRHKLKGLAGIYRNERNNTTAIDVRLVSHYACTGGVKATIEFDDNFWDDLTPEGWVVRFRLIDALMANSARRLRGQMIVDLMNEPWSLNYVDDDALQKLESAAMKTMEFIDNRRRKFEL